MAQYSIVGFCQIYNELEKGNLERFVKYMMPLVDALVVYDDGSTDGSYEYMLQVTPYVIRGIKNNFADEINHKQLLLEEALKLSPDFILWLDADEVISANPADELQNLCDYCIVNNLDALSFHEINIWRSHSWQRTDSKYNNGWFVRLWRVSSDIHYTKAEPGLHQLPYPTTIEKIKRIKTVQVLHYGFASKKNLAYKYLVYKSHGQRGYYMLDRLISEEQLVLKKIPQKLFPQGLWTDDEQPMPLTFEESLTYVEQYRETVFRPKFSIICLIYKSIEWLQFVYEQVLKYTDMTDKEFFFVANDANEEILEYLRDNYIPHFIYNNTPEQQLEWFINNVYRAYNYACSKAQGDFMIFINSDMGFTPGWFECLWEAYNGSNCITSRLVESGKMRSGLYGIEKNFGRDINSYREQSFLLYADSEKCHKTEDGGLFMPLLIRKQHFQMVGGYPEGNVIPGSDIFNPVIAKQGEPCISGDNTLMQKLSTNEITHQTAFDSIVYHFQAGELNSSDAQKLVPKAPQIAICNDLLTGSMGEKVLWDFLLESLPSSIGIDCRVVGNNGNFASNARNYLQQYYPDIKIIIQNATFIDLIDTSRYTIAFLQDNLRAMIKPSKQQERNLRAAHKLVTNTVQNTVSYPEFNFDIIPVGIDYDLFKPMDKSSIRQELGYGTERIGIFVGNFSEVKGWSLIKECIEYFKDISWILVSKYHESFAAPSNVRVYNRISQELLAKLLNCSDFFIIGSKIETQCLAAVEACLCDVPVVMHNTGIFKDFAPEERKQCGIFGSDFFAAIQELPQQTFTPRQVIMQRSLSIEDSMKKWTDLIVSVFQEIRAAKCE